MRLPLVQPLQLYSRDSNIPQCLFKFRYFPFFNKIETWYRRRYEVSGKYLHQQKVYTWYETWYIIRTGRGARFCPLNCLWVAPHKSWVTGNTLTSEEDPILSQESKVSGSRQSTLNIFCSFPVHSTERCAVKWTSFYCLRSSNPSPLKATNSLQRPIFFEPILDR